MTGYSLETSSLSIFSVQTANFPGDGAVCRILKHKPSLEELHTDSALAGRAPPNDSQTVTLPA